MKEVLSLLWQFGLEIADLGGGSFDACKSGICPSPRTQPISQAGRIWGIISSEKFVNRTRYKQQRRFLLSIAEEEKPRKKN